jgi:hypothetical protein
MKSNIPWALLISVSDMSSWPNKGREKNRKSRATETKEEKKRCGSSEHVIASTYAYLFIVVREVKADEWFLRAHTVARSSR